MNLNSKSKLAFCLPKIKECEIGVFCTNKEEVHSMRHLKDLHIIYLEQREDRFEIDSFHEGCLHSMIVCADNFRKFLKNFKLIIIKDTQNNISELLKKERVEYITLGNSEVSLKQSVQITAEIINNFSDSLINHSIEFFIASKKEVYDHICIFVGPKAPAESFLTISRDLNQKTSNTIHLGLDLDDRVEFVGLSFINNRSSSLYSMKEPLASFHNPLKRVPIFLLCED